MKKWATLLSILTIICTGHFVLADDGPICQMAAESLAQSDSDPNAQTPSRIGYPHITKLTSGWDNRIKSSLIFESGQVVDWGLGDVLALHSKEDQSLSMFIPNSEPNPLTKKCDYSDYGKNTCTDERGGYLKVAPSSLMSGDFTCPEDGYSSAWLKPEVGATYCIRSRYEKKYALMQIRALCKETNSIVFQWTKSRDRTFHASVQMKLN